MLSREHARFERWADVVQSVLGLLGERERQLADLREIEAAARQFVRKVSGVTKPKGDVAAASVSLAATA